MNFSDNDSIQRHRWLLTKGDFLVLLQPIGLQQFEDFLRTHVEVLRGHYHEQVRVEAVLHHVFRRRRVLLCRVTVLFEHVEVQLGPSLPHGFGCFAAVEVSQKVHLEEVIEVHLFA